MAMAANSDPHRMFCCIAVSFKVRNMEYPRGVCRHIALLLAEAAKTSLSWRSVRACEALESLVGSTLNAVTTSTIGSTRLDGSEGLARDGKCLIKHELAANCRKMNAVLR
jgi:hypothetical protein